MHEMRVPVVKSFVCNVALEHVIVFAFIRLGSRPEQ